MPAYISKLQRTLAMTQRQEEEMGILSFTTFFVSTIILSSFSEYSIALDTISETQTITENSTLVSKSGEFELGFFSPGRSTNRYVGIWYKDIPGQIVVWVANRQNPINDSSGILMINSTGHVVLHGQMSSVVWSASPTQSVQAPILQLLDTGNLVLRDEKDENSHNYLWQSFDYPTDTLLPGMKLGWDLKTGLDRRIVSWKSPDDPSPGDFSWMIARYNYPEGQTWKASNKYYRDGPWNGLRFSGDPELKPNSLFTFEFVNHKDEVYYIFHLRNESVKTRMVVNQTYGYIRTRYAWNPGTQSWDVFSSMPRDNCDGYGLCGAYGNCVIWEAPVCQCLKGFKPKGNFMDWSQGCVRNKPLSCHDKHSSGFVKISGLKLPDTTYTWVNASLNLKECKAKCMSNCSCTAYTNSDISGKGSGCAMWFGNLIDIRELQVSGQDLYVRLDASELGGDGEHAVIIGVVIVAVFVVVCGVVLLARYIRQIRTRKYLKETSAIIKNVNNENQAENMDVIFFDLDKIITATCNFSSNNKLGQGGFGPVYKGTLEDGKELAVKRLSRNSSQGVNEFKNEVALIAKLQHRNLVKLLGCCLQGEEKMLVYEYMPNNSLDHFIFDETKSKLIDWSKRFHIISGVARGLLYLHQDSRLRIIHRDLKTSNILLDTEMNPKISDFGLARAFGGDQSEGNTSRVVGTCGYMAPEYAVDGLFSVKSDVFSFGILLLEIISGKRNRGFYHLHHTINLIGHAWRLFKEGRSLELVDPCLKDSSDLSEVLRSIHISLLCVQEHPEDRPSMSHVVLMLGGESTLSQPKQPAFSVSKNTVATDSSSSKQESVSTNEITVTLLEPR
ncbi:G-type lectin S-receptor-like serine/threonine-protein kinase At4g27290 isoform X2 [Ziziphus jujuba]|uniref:Receptor-like serine/threonine-protein kinase n=1 Tax=Ziziphus jujuba TaxID=326968 RepID=A0ABM4AEF0_ZIZJJ|nr:G-type lectin S-receptor-like serine/threonine-protein kinase At4g27290 isoform X2 [Ziziphus jujuba]